MTNKRARTPRGLDVVLLALISAALAYQLLVPPNIGLADNGDFSRVAYPLGIYALQEIGSAQFFGWIVPRYRFDAKRIWFHGLCCYSSQTLFGVLALPAARLISSKGEFRIKSRGIINGLSFLAATWVLLLALRPLHLTLHLLAGVLLLLVFSDVAYAAYFNSFYTEPSTLIFFLASVGFALQIAQRPDPPRSLLLSFVLSAALLATSRPQNAMLGLVFAGLGLRLVRHTANRSRRRFLAVAVGALSLLCLWYFRQTPRPLHKVFLYNTVFYDLLRNSPNPHEDLAALGLPADFDRLIGTVAFTPGIPISEESFQRAFFRRISYATIVRFYLVRPARFWKAIERAAGQAFKMRPLELGNYARTTGKPAGSQSQSFAIWSGAKERLAPGHAWFVITYLLTNLAVAAVVRRLARSRALALAGEIWAAIALVAALQFAVATLGGGTSGLIRHFFLFNAASDVLFVALCILAGAGLLAILQARRRDATRECWTSTAETPAQ